MPKIAHPPGSVITDREAFPGEPNVDPDAMVQKELNGVVHALRLAREFISGLSQYDNKVLPKRAYEEARSILGDIRGAEHGPRLAVLRQMVNRGHLIKVLEVENAQLKGQVEHDAAVKKGYIEQIASCKDALAEERNADPRTRAQPRLLEDAKLGHELVNLLMTVCGDGGTSEGAVECLERILKERKTLKDAVTSDACRTGASSCTQCGALAVRTAEGNRCLNCGYIMRKPTADHSDDCACPGCARAGTGRWGAKVAQLKEPNHHAHTLYISGPPVPANSRGDNMYEGVFGEDKREPGALVPVRANVSAPAIRMPNGKRIELAERKPITLRLHNPVIERSADWHPDTLKQLSINLFGGPRALWKPDPRYVDKFGLSYITLHGFRFAIDGTPTGSASPSFTVRDATGLLLFASFPENTAHALPVPVVIGGPGEAADWGFVFERNEFRLKSLSIVIDIEQSYVSL